MEWLKKWLNRVFIDGLSGMALGLFSTLIVGTIIQQVGTLIGGQVGEITYLAGKLAAALEWELLINSKSRLWWCFPQQRQVWQADLPARF